MDRRAEANPVRRWRDLNRERLVAWSAGAAGLLALLGFWFAVARQLAWA